jgi:thiol-disulfide isomerase/thioredoxin
MKKHLLLIPALLFSMLGFSQGIEFEHGTWNDVLAKAQQTNKPVFVNVYTSWCGPYKTMSKEIFPLEEVGKVYNANFVCYQVDAEKGEGAEITKHYEVAGYLTYLFIKGDGTLFYIADGAKTAKDFIAISNMALTEMNDPRSIAVWEKEYAEKKNDPTFLLGYIDKRSKLRMSKVSLFDEYLKLIPKEELVSDTVAALYKEGQNLKVNSFAYANLQKNRTRFAARLDSVEINSILFQGIMNTVDEAAKSKNEQLLDTAMIAYSKLPKNAAFMRKDEVYIHYYERTGETDKSLKSLINLTDNTLMKISDDTIVQRDKVHLRNFEKSLKSGAYAKYDSVWIARVRIGSSYQERDEISETLNNIAWQVFRKTSDKNLLQDALRLSKRSVELSPNKSLFLDTYANLLYKLGRKKEAIAKEGDALRYARDVFRSKTYEETIRKMKAGEKTW